VADRGPYASALAAQPASPREIAAKSGSSAAAGLGASRTETGDVAPAAANGSRLLKK